MVFSRSYLHRQVSPPETLVVKGGTTWGREMVDEFCLKMPEFHVTFRGLLRAVNLRHGTNGFTSLPNEGVLRIFSPSKIRRLRPGLNPRSWVPKASAKSRLLVRYSVKNLAQIFSEICESTAGIQLALK